MNIKFDFKDKITIVTGCASGIGRGIAEAFGKAGATVVAADINVLSAQETSNVINDKGGNSTYIEFDVSDEESVKALVDYTCKEYGRIDILVNNAGVVGSINGYPLTGFSGDDWDKNYKINLKGLFHSSKATYNTFKEQKQGKIINIASISGKTGDISDLALFEYSCMKSAAIHFTQLLSKELGPYNINVNCVCPGFVYTPLYEYAAPLIKEKYPDLFEESLSSLEVVEKMASMWSALGRPQTPEDIANAVLFLASDEAENITGQALNVCSGTESH